MSAVDTIHASCVALDGRAILLTGPSGVGKSDLALRLIDRGWELVSDDYTIVTARDEGLFATAPVTIAGQIEIRGIGIVTMPCRADLPVFLCCELGMPVARMPEPRCVRIAGVHIPCTAISALEPSAPIKVEQALYKASIA